MKLLRSLLTFALVCAAATSVAAADRVGTRSLAVPAPHRVGTSLNVTVWYPAAAGGKPVLVGDDRLFKGTAAWQDAPPAAGRFPLVLVSHGSGGNIESLGWIASSLAARGFIVAGPNHHGTTRGNSTPIDTTRIWQRPADLSAVLTAMMADPEWGPYIDPGRIGAFGFSLGGHTALAIGGARVTAEAYARYCDEEVTMPDCVWFASGGVDLRAVDKARFEQSNRDPRIKAIVAIDPSIAQALTPESLHAMSARAAIINLGPPGHIPVSVDSAWIARAIPGASYATVEDAVHFSFLAECQPGARAFLQETGDRDALCDDAGGRTRDLLHTRLAEMIAAAFDHDLGNMAVGLQDLRSDDAATGRHLLSYVWYPTRSTAPTSRIEENAVRVGFQAIRNAATAPGHYPLVVLSHGWGGNRGNEAWLAVELATRGAIVVAPNHPGTTTGDTQSAETPKLWERARDVSRVIDAMLADGRFGNLIDPARIAVIGHSMGGYTAMAVAGARLDPALAARDCDEHPELAACEWYRKHRVDAAQAATYAQDVADPRVRAVVSLDLGFTGALTPGSLQAIAIPVLVMAAGSRNPQMNVALESRRLAARLPPATTSYVEIAGASHFSFMGECKPGAYELLAAEAPGDEILCIDGDMDGGDTSGRQRAGLHAAMLTEIEAFLQQAGILADASGE
ncbi:MAG: alpha/beta fold hydrolase [Geminicoccaceae bacterium]